MELASMTRCSGAAALEHRQFPRGPSFVEPKNIKTAVVGADLDVTVVSAMPLIEEFNDRDRAPVEVYPLRQLVSAVSGLAFDSNPHGSDRNPLRMRPSAYLPMAHKHRDRAATGRANS